MVADRQSDELATWPAEVTHRTYGNDACLQWVTSRRHSALRASSALPPKADISEQTD